MKTAYRIFKRKSRPHFYLENCATKVQRCLFTEDRREATRGFELSSSIGMTGWVLAREMQIFDRC